MRRTLSALLLSVAASLGAAACGPADTDESSTAAPGDDEKADTLNPTGSDKLGRLTVVAPDPGTTGLVATHPSAYLVDNQIVYKAPTATRLTAGKHLVGLYLHNGPAYDLAEVTLEKGKTTELRLAGLHLDHLWDYTTTIGLAPRWVPTRLGADFAYAGAPGAFLELMAQPLSLALQADKELARFDFTPEAGKVVSYDVAIPEPRIAMPVTTPDRTLPTAVSARFVRALYLPANRILSTYGSGAILRSDGVKLVDGAMHSALGSDKTAQHYIVYLNGTWAELTGAAGTSVEVPVRRLDVRDVEVDDEDGNVTTTRGKWSLEWFAPTTSGGMWIAAEEAQQLLTNTGVDVVPGKYKVTVTYPRQEQPSPGTSVYEIEIK